MELKVAQECSDVEGKADQSCIVQWWTVSWGKVLSWKKQTPWDPQGLAIFRNFRQIGQMFCQSLIFEREYLKWHGTVICIQTLSIWLGIQFRQRYGQIKDTIPPFKKKIFLAFHDPETRGVQELILSLFEIRSWLTYGWKSVIFWWYFHTFHENGDGVLLKIRLKNTIFSHTKNYIPGMFVFLKA